MQKLLILGNCVEDIQLLTLLLLHIENYYGLLFYTFCQRVIE